VTWISLWMAWAWDSTAALVISRNVSSVVCCTSDEIMAATNRDNVELYHCLHQMELTGNHFMVCVNSDQECQRCYIFILVPPRGVKADTTIRTPHYSSMKRFLGSHNKEQGLFLSFIIGLIPILGCECQIHVVWVINTLKQHQAFWWQGHATLQKILKLFWIFFVQWASSGWAVSLMAVWKLGWCPDKG